ncbi:MAG: hypothetical protein HYV63_33580 [Candidatus Schekmanbacteria bacterium]|nr:hypothetical protein [Candidatus Schekmanbacteria bacterium]
MDDFGEDAPRLSTGRKVSTDSIESILDALLDEIYVPEASRLRKLDDATLYPLVGREIEGLVERLTEEQAKALLVPSLMSLFHAHVVLVRQRAMRTMNDGRKSPGE